MHHVQRQRLVQRTNAVSYYPKILIPNCPMSRGRKIVVHLRIVRVRKIVQRRKCAVSNCSEILISFVRCRGAGSILFTFDLSACGYFKNHHSIFDIQFPWMLSLSWESLAGLPLTTESYPSHAPCPTAATCPTNKCRVLLPENF